MTNILVILLSMDDTQKIDTIKKWLGSGSINIFGRPFSGKDSQGQKMAEILGGNFITSGEILRGNTMPDHIKECMHTGALVPSADYAKIVLPYLAQPELAEKPLILSSFGRWHGEEDGTMATALKSGHPIKIAVYLNIDEAESYERLQNLEVKNDRINRRDDSRETLVIRSAEFHEKTLSVLDYYRNLGLLIEIDGKGPRDEITRSIIVALYKKAASQTV